jgi:pimeloyl-ACP methyl ester carboxylesterase
MGHSMGGSIISQVAADYPELVRGLILEDPGYSSEQPSAAEMAARTQASETKLRDYQALTHDELLAKVHSNHPTWSDEEVRYCADARLQLTPRISQWHCIRATTSCHGSWCVCSARC